MEKINSPFIPKKTVYHEYKFDEEYVSYEVKDVVKKIGEGEEDFVITQKLIEKREPIKEVIARDAGTTGIQAVMQRALLTGDTSILPDPLPKTGVVSDYTEVPDNLLDADLYAKAMEAKFNALPEEVRKGRSFDEFCQFFTQDEFNAWMNAMLPKKEEKKEGDN